MKSLEELKRIREEAKKLTQIRKGDHGTKIVVGMGTCGIAAGARQVMTAILDELQKRNITDVIVTQTGCIGFCKYEPLIDVYKPGQPKVTYVNLTPEMAREIVVKHIINNQVIEKWVVPNF
ncbi:MAG: (2Fe-2S) ferredoxin domain-containing protein [Firmicutes bacterium]|jgi:NADP-reducing hydrogenase subunit HndB|nr:(2Fe-2S) ferredoxin domain-containing protein [Bacillota bacterium]